MFRSRETPRNRLERVLKVSQKDAPNGRCGDQAAGNRERKQIEPDLRHVARLAESPPNPLSDLDELVAA